MASSVPTRPRLLIAATAAVLVMLSLAAGQARAAITSCTFSGTTVTATTDFSATFGTLSVAGGAIQADGAPCGAATVANTDLIQVIDGPGSGSPQIRLDLSGGPFAPGATAEGSGDPEIEIDITLTDVDLPTLEIVGSSGPDRIVAGLAGINLNAAESTDDADVTISLVGGDPIGVLDRLIGGSGDDLLSNAGGEGTGSPWPSSTPLIDGGPDDDELRAGTEDATMTGGGGADALYGGPDDLDTLYGGPGDDDLHGGPGDDELHGDSGFDILAGDAGSDSLDGGTDDDWAAYDDAPGSVTATLPGGTAVGGDGYGATDTYASMERLEGSQWADTLTGDGGDNIVFAGGGDDVVDGRGGDDAIRGWTGNDTIDGGAGDDGIHGDDGDDTLYGGAGDDELVDGSGADSVFGQRGNDRIEASEWDPDLGRRPIGDDLLSGGPGVDEVDYWFRGGVTVTLDGLANDGEPGEHDNVGGPGGDVENVVGSPGSDVLVGDDGDNVLDGFSGGGDLLDGAGGRDELLGRSGSDHLIGGEGKDTLDGGTGTDKLEGGNGKDLLLADDGEQDVVDGGNGRDTGDVDVLDVLIAVEVLV